jgi:membrane-associated protease RseP (regulator of RpoE activity)
MNRNTTLLLALMFALLLAGCGAVPRAPSRGTVEAAPAATARYETEPGRDPAVVAQLRAGPAPATPEFVDGGNPAGDRARLAAQGLLPVGTGYFATDESHARAAAVAQARSVGSDRILWYAPAQDTSAPEWIAVHYVRFRLPFGATFRDLRPAERAQAKSGGVAIGAVVGGTPASRANLRRGDLVVACDGKSVAGRVDFQALLRRRAGRAITLTLLRDGVRLKRVVRLGVMPER